MERDIQKHYEELPQGTREHVLYQEQEGRELIQRFGVLGIWQGLEERNRLEPAIRCAHTAGLAAVKLNILAEQAGLDNIVSPRVTFCVGLLLKTGQVIDKNLVEQFDLASLDPVDLGLYRYPAYAKERTIQNNNVLRLSLLLHRLNAPWYSHAILHGPYPEFFERAELPTILAMLANANLSFDETNRWHAYLHPGVGLLAISPYATRSDELTPQESKDWVDRARMVAINTALQHTFRMYAGIEFSDESFADIPDEPLQRWRVVQEVFQQIGLSFPSPDTLKDQQRKKELLFQWIHDYEIEKRLKETQRTTGHRLYDHSVLVAQLMQHLGKELNRFSFTHDHRYLVNPDYLYGIGLAHDSIKAFLPSEVAFLQSLQKYETDFLHTYPPEVVARGTISLASSHDAQLFAFLNWYEEGRQRRKQRGMQGSIAQDVLSGPYHLFSLISGLLSYADLSVVSKQELAVSCYKPDITDRFLDTTMRYISDPHTAIMGYAKLMTLAASLSWYLGVRFPQEGDVLIQEEHLSHIPPKWIGSKESAISALQHIRRALQIFGIVIPSQLRNLQK